MLVWCSFVLERGLQRVKERAIKQSLPSALWLWWTYTWRGCILETSQRWNTAGPPVMHGFVSRRAAHFVTTRAFDSINLTDIFRRAAHAASADISEIKCRAALWVLLCL